MRYALNAMIKIPKELYTTNDHYIENVENKLLYAR